MEDSKARDTDAIMTTMATASASTTMKIENPTGSPTGWSWSQLCDWLQLNGVPAEITKLLRVRSETCDLLPHYTKEERIDVLRGSGVPGNNYAAIVNLLDRLFPTKKQATTTTTASRDQESEALFVVQLITAHGLRWRKPVIEPVRTAEAFFGKYKAMKDRMREIAKWLEPPTKYNISEAVRTFNVLTLADERFLHSRDLLQPTTATHSTSAPSTAADPVTKKQKIEKPTDTEHIDWQRHGNVVKAARSVMATYLGVRVEQKAVHWGTETIEIPNGVFLGVVAPPDSPSPSHSQAEAAQSPLSSESTPSSSSASPSPRHATPSKRSSRSGSARTKPTEQKHATASPARSPQQTAASPRRTVGGRERKQTSSGSTQPLAARSSAFTPPRHTTASTTSQTRSQTMASTPSSDQQSTAAGQHSHAQPLTSPSSIINIKISPQVKVSQKPPVQQTPRARPAVAAGSDLASLSLRSIQPQPPRSSVEPHTPIRSADVPKPKYGLPTIFPHQQQRQHQQPAHPQESSPTPMQTDDHHWPFPSAMHSTSTSPAPAVGLSPRSSASSPLSMTTSDFPLSLASSTHPTSAFDGTDGDEDIGLTPLALVGTPTIEPTTPASLPASFLSSWPAEANEHTDTDA